MCSATKTLHTTPLLYLDLLHPDGVCVSPRIYLITQAVSLAFHPPKEKCKFGAASVEKQYFEGHILIEEVARVPHERLRDPPNFPEKILPTGVQTQQLFVPPSHVPFFSKCESSAKGNGKCLLQVPWERAVPRRLSRGG